MARGCGLHCPEVGAFRTPARHSDEESCGNVKFFAALKRNQKITTGGGVVRENPGNRKKSDFLPAGTFPEIPGILDGFLRFWRFSRARSRPGQGFLKNSQEFSRFSKIFEAPEPAGGPNPLYSL